MASRTDQILQAIESALIAINGTGSYTNDLSGTDQVTFGRPRPECSRYPAAWINLARLQGGFGFALVDQKRTLVVEIEGRVQPSEQTPRSRCLAAIAMLNDFSIALEASAVLQGLTWSMEGDGTWVDGDEVGLLNIGIAYVEVTFSWDQIRGAGI